MESSTRHRDTEQEPDERDDAVYDRSLVLLKASAVTTARMTRDAAGKAPRIEAMVLEIRDHLFDPDLNVNRLKAWLAIRDNSIPIHFHSAVGSSPAAYIQEARVEVACRLLESTDWAIWRISKLLGYSSIQVFSRAFSRLVEIRPSKYRRQVRRDGVAPPWRPSRDRVHELDAALRGELGVRRAFELIAHLEEIYGPVRPIGRPS